MFDFQRTFRPTPEQKLQHDEFALKVMKQALADKSCATCVHGHPENIPKFGVVTICDRGGDRSRGEDIASETCERYQASEKEVERIKELEETIKREKEAVEEKRKQERRELLTARGTSKTRKQFIEKYGFDPWEDKR